MSTQITTAFVQQYSANVFHLSQQKGSRLRMCVRVEPQTGKSAFYDRIGAATAQKRTSRHADTPQIDTPHSRRRVTLEDYEYADLIDDSDKLRLLMDPAGQYTIAAMWALGRSMDDEIIIAASGTAYSGETGSTSVSLGNAQTLVATDGVSTSGVNLNVFTLRKAKKVLDGADVDPSIKRYFAFSASQSESLLNETEVTSADFNTVKALVQGDINTFMGFEFIRSQRLATTSASTTFAPADGSVGAGTGTLSSGARMCFGWAEDGLLLANAQDIKARISERDDKSYSTQVFASMGIGSTRMEEAKVVEVRCNEA